MADASMYSVASKLLSTIATPAVEQAYYKVCSIWHAKDELAKLQRSIQTIHAVLLDAEMRQDSSAAVKEWIKRVRDVLYEADDLFDEVVTDDMHKEQILRGGNKMLSKVRVFCSKLNPIVSRDSIAKKVKAIRKSLLKISNDMTQFQFVIRQVETPSSSVRNLNDPGWFVHPNVFGREDDKRKILELLFNESDSVEPGVIAIVGIGGMGKTTLAQLIYKHDEVEKKFKKRWFACISDTSDEKEFLVKIFKSIRDEDCSSFTVGQLQTKIHESLEGIKNFLLVLDNVWDEIGRLQDRMSLLSNGSRGIKIIVTTRSLAVARAVGARESTTHYLSGLSNDESWDLFKKVAFTSEQESDSRWTDLGIEIVKKCANVPLAIRSIGSLLYTKTTIQEWEFFKDQELSRMEEQISGDDSIMNRLKLSYEHLPPKLKHCFAYCSLFPKGFQFDVKMLVYFWIAQGYITPDDGSQTVEQVGSSYFMDLFRRCVFQEAKYNERGEIESCKMHDLIHDLAKLVSGEEICIGFKDSARHVGIVCGMDKPWEDFARLRTSCRVRSVIYIHYSDLSFLEENLTKFKFLRTLSLGGLRIENVSSSIGELKHLRYVDLSKNPLKSLPDSMTNLLNLQVLNLSGCNFRALPDKFRKLINLRFLNIGECKELKHMPPRFEELTSLRYLSNFEVGKTSEGVQMSGLDALVGLMQQLRGALCITFHMGSNDWSGDGCWQLPVSPHTLRILSYPGRRILPWGNGGEIVLNLASLKLDSCPKVKYLPPISLLPNLKSLYLYHLEELEYLELEEVEYLEAENSSRFFRCLEVLELVAMPKLKGWRNVAAQSHEDPHHLPLLFPCLSRLLISSCPELKPFSLCPHLQTVYLCKIVGIQQWISSFRSNTSFLQMITIEHCNDITSFTDYDLASLRELFIWGCSSLTSLHLTSPHLEKILIRVCHGLMSFQVEALPTLLSLTIENCMTLKNLQISHLNALEYLEISECPELELWGQDEENRCQIDWNSLPNLRELAVNRLPPPENLPESLRSRQALGELQLTT